MEAEEVLGNLRYKSSTNRSPTKFTEGKEGESLSLRLELRLLGGYWTIRET